MAVAMEKLLDLMVDKGAADLHLTVGIPPTIRMHGKLKPLNTPALTPADTEMYMKSITPESGQEELAVANGTDFGYAFGDKARFRVAVFRQKGNIGMTLRQIPSELLTFDQIGLPESVKSVLSRPRGLVLITGPTGSGKTTTLATMIDFINQNYDRHIITIEDPIEYYHDHKTSIVNQREVGNDIGSFAEALRRALRMDPDTILVGEMRDLETISAAVTAAETGHLVFATLHTTGATKTVNRLVDVFPTDQQEQIRAQLASSLVTIISQVLLPRKDKPGVVAAFEIMVVNHAVQNMIRENQTHKLISAIQTGANQGMVLLDDHLYTLVQEGKVDYQVALESAQAPPDFARKVKEGGGF